MSITTLVILEFFGFFDGNLKWDEYGISADQAGQIISLLVMAIIIGFTFSVVSGISYVVAKIRSKVTRHKDDKYESSSISNSMNAVAPMENEKLTVMDAETPEVIEEIMMINAQKDTLLSELTQTRSEIDSAKTKLTDLNSQIQDAQAELNSLQVQYARGQEDIVSAKKDLEFIEKELSIISQKEFPVTKSDEALHSETKKEFKIINKRRSEFFSFLSEQR